MREAEEIKEWIKKAEDDYAGALHINRRRKKPLPDLVCFHCQQAVEKYLKAFLIFKEITFPKTHDLVALLELCKEFVAEFELWRNCLSFSILTLCNSVIQVKKQVLMKQELQLKRSNKFGLLCALAFQMRFGQRQIVETGAITLQNLAEFPLAL